MVLHFCFAFALLELNCLVQDNYFRYLVFVVVTVVLASRVNDRHILGGLIQ